MNKIIDWLNWNVRINFIDNVWWPLFGKEKKPNIKMTSENLISTRKEFGLTPKQMAKMLGVSPMQYKGFEKTGLLAPHETQGSIICIIKVIKSILDQNAENKTILDELGYKGKM